MRHFCAILFLLVLGINLFGQNDKLPNLIASSLKLFEPNPCYSEEAEKINNLFKDLIINSKNNLETNIMDQFDSLYKTGLSEFEDNLDMRRVKMKQCICLASIAILSDKERFEFFIDLAEHCITDSSGKPFEFLEKPYCGLKLLRIYLELSFELNIQYDLNDLNKSLELYKQSLPSDFYYGSKMIIEKNKK